LGSRFHLNAATLESRRLDAGWGAIGTELIGAHASVANLCADFSVCDDDSTNHRQVMQ
jgi:hypothetical protein